MGAQMLVRYKAIQMGDLAAEQRSLTPATAINDCELIEVEWCCDTARQEAEYGTIAFGESFRTTDPQMNIVDAASRTPFRFCPWCAAPVVLECVKTVRLRKTEEVIPEQRRPKWIEEDVT